MKTTIYTLFLVASVLLISCGVGGKRIAGTGPMIENARLLTPVTDIVLDGAMNLRLNSAEVQSIVVHAQSQVQPVLKTEMKGETLTITTEGNVAMGDGTYVDIMIPMLKSISITGSGNVEGGGFVGDKLNITSKSSGSIRLNDLKYDDINLKIDGSGNADLSGRSKKLDVESDSSGKVNASNLVVDKAKATTKGSGDIMVSVGGDLKAKIVGSGNIMYDGSPKVELDDTGSGELKGSN
jgi:hypothetical protein